MAPMNWALVRDGDVGSTVSAVQFLLREHGAAIAADGIFGPFTDGAVRQFQGDHGLAVDGIVGNQTWPALIVSVAEGSTGEAVRVSRCCCRLSPSTASSDPRPTMRPGRCRPGSASRPMASSVP